MLFAFGATANAGAADAAPRTSCKAHALLETYSANYHAVAKTHGKRAPGRNIRKWGLKSKPSSCKHIAKSLRTLRSMRFAGNTILVASAPSVAPAGTQTLRSSGGILDKIKKCESGGDYSARSGPYSGAFQFDQQTWNSVGGSGDPGSASPAEQDKRAAMLYAQRGGSPWPVCSR